MEKSTTNNGFDKETYYNTIIDWASEFKGLDLKLSKEYNVAVRDNGNNTAMIKGNVNKIKDFLLGSDYNLSEDRFNEEYSELNKKIDLQMMNELYAFLKDENTMHDPNSDLQINTIADAKEFLTYCLEQEINTAEMKLIYNQWQEVLGKMPSQEKIQFLLEPSTSDNISNTNIELMDEKIHNELFKEPSQEDRERALKSFNKNNKNIQETY